MLENDFFILENDFLILENEFLILENRNQISLHTSGRCTCSKDLNRHIRLIHVNGTDLS